MAVSLAIEPDVDDITLASVLRNALGPDAQLDGLWHGRPVHGGFGGQGLYRFAGEARTRNEVRPWSAVLKVCPPKVKIATWRPGMRRGGRRSPTPRDFWTSFPAHS